MELRGYCSAAGRLRRRLRRDHIPAPSTERARRIPWTRVPPSRYVSAAPRVIDDVSRNDGAPGRTRRDPRGACPRRAAARRAAASRLRPRRAALDPPRRARGAARASTSRCASSAGRPCPASVEDLVIAAEAGLPPDPVASRGTAGATCTSTGKRASRASATGASFTRWTARPAARSCGTGSASACYTRRRSAPASRASSRPSTGTGPRGDGVPAARLGRTSPSSTSGRWSHEVPPGVEVEVRMEGDTWETEDQRNWSDSSFKTYGTPLAAAVPGRDRRRHRRPAVGLAAPLRPHGRAGGGGGGDGARRPAEAAQQRGAGDRDRARRAPGAGAAGRSASAGAASRSYRRDGGIPAAPPRPRPPAGRDPLRGESRGGRRRSTSRRRTRRPSDVPLELAVHVPEAPRERPCARSRSGPPRCGRASARGCCSMPRGCRRPRDWRRQAARRSRAAAPGARLGGGSDRYFTEMNRSRPPGRPRRVSFSLNPQVHAFDDATIFENLATLHWLAETARAFAAGADISISPATLRPRQDPRPPASRPPRTTRRSRTTRGSRRLSPPRGRSASSGRPPRPGSPA